MTRRDSWPVSSAGHQFLLVRRHDVRGDEKPLAPPLAAMTAEQWLASPRLERALHAIEAGALGRTHRPAGVHRRPLVDALSRGDLAMLSLAFAPVVVAAPPKTHKVLGPHSAPTWDLTVHVLDCAGNDLAGIELVFTVDGKKLSATTDASGIAEVKKVGAPKGKVSPKDKKALFDKLKKPWADPLAAQSWPASEVRGVESFADVVVDSALAMTTIVLAPYDLLVRFAIPGDTKKLPHSFTLESEDGSISQTKAAKTATSDGDFYELWFTHLVSAQSYRLTCTGGPSDTTIFDWTPYQQLAANLGAMAPSKMPFLFYP
jgi:hypothetical protein